MGVIIRMPMINVNDDTVELVRWVAGDGTLVSKGDTICIVETTKSAVDVVSEHDGFLRHMAQSGASYSIGYPLAFVAQSEHESLPETATPKEQSVIETMPSQPVWTKKAKILAEKLGVDLALLVQMNPGKIVGEELVQTAATEKTILLKGLVSSKSHVTPIPLLTSTGVKRVLILGGGGGASLVLDILARTLEQQAIGILDNNPDLIGTSVMGVPVLGNFDVARQLWQEKKFDMLISTVVRDVSDRALVFQHFSELGIPFANVIDPSVRIGKEVTLGQGNLIVYGGYLATGVSLGNNNFLAAGTYIEHHSTIGSHCTFGPRTSFSGKVTVGDRVKFGTHVAVEPQIEIGAESMIASGVILTAHVPPGSIVKSSTTPVIRYAK